MYVKFWGVRGSIPTPGPDTVKYGGNTPCLEVRTDEGDCIILDAGTGIRPLGLLLARKMPITASLFITHTHWDHIQGLPFFIPLFVPGNQLSIYGASDPVTMLGIKDVLSVQMEYRYFPVREAELKATLSYASLHEGETVSVGSASITPIVMNHPVFTLGYRIESNGKTLFYTGDHEQHSNIYAPEDEDYSEYEKWIVEKRQQLVDFIHGCNLLIADAQYTESEYPGKIGWGHSTHEAGLALAKESGAKSLLLTHHEPTRPDSALDAIHERVRETGLALGLEAGLAYEGLEVVL